jgi:hypothetical protein
MVQLGTPGSIDFCQGVNGCGGAVWYEMVIAVQSPTLKPGQNSPAKAVTMIRNYVVVHTTPALVRTKLSNFAPPPPPAAPHDC